MFSRTLALLAATTLSAAVVVLAPATAQAGPADAPSAPIRYFSTPSGAPLQGNFCVGATDPQGDDPDVVAVDAAPYTVTYTAESCAFTITPPPNTWGQHPVKFKLSDGVNVSDWQMLVISVGRPGNAPVIAQPDVLSAGKNVALSIPDYNGHLLANDVDPEGAPMTVSNNATPESGLLPGEDLRHAPFIAPTAYVYQPPTGFVGTRRFTYLADDGVNLTQQVLTITVTDKGPQKAPVAVADSYTVPRNGTLAMSKATGVLANDSDADSAYFRVVGPTQPAHGTLTDFNTYAGTWTYTPALGFVGTDSFTYRLEDSEGNQSSTVTVTLHVVTPPPVATVDTYKTAQSTTKVVDAAHGLLANDTDPDSPDLRVGGVLTSGMHGSFVVDNETGAFTWTPTPGWSGTDTVIYRAQDAEGNTSAWTNVTLTAVAPGVNQAPDAKADAYQVRQGTPLTIAAPGLLANDDDFENADLDLTAIGAPAHGSLTAVDSESGAFTYTGDPGWHGTDAFTYRAVDPQGATSAPVTVTVEVFNDKPLVEDDAYTTVPGVPFVVTAAEGLLVNDSDLENEAIQLHSTWPPAHGAVITQADGSFTYTPHDGFEGVDTFRYDLRDAAGQSSAQATVTITVQPGTITSSTPSVTGTARVGRVLTAGTATWGPGTVTKSYRWLRDGAPITGATGASYTLAAADLGRKVSVRVTGTKAGYPTVARTSAGVVVARGLLTTARPRIAGTPVAGRLLKAHAGTWGPGTVTKTFRWYRNGVAIKGATRASYRLTKADRGRRITVRVTGRKTAYLTVVRTSTALRVR